MEKIERVVDFNNDHSRYDFIRELQSLRGLLRFKVAPAKNSLTNQQREYYFSSIVKYLVEYCRAQGDVVNKDDCHEMLKDMCFPNVDEVYSKATGLLIGKKRRSIMDLNVSQMSEYIERCIMFLAEMGIVVPDPSEYREKDVDMQQMR